MIYTAFGLPVIKVVSGNIKENKAVIEVYSGLSEIEILERTVSELRADAGLNEIHDAINNPGSYEQPISVVKEYFERYCK